ncbi:MAG: hypothetical protein ACOYT4_00820 [Nanoarchaeota archaeon]
MTPYNPGKIIYSENMCQVPILGIVLPKERFASKFLESRNLKEWPENLEVNNKTEHEFGRHMPASLDIDNQNIKRYGGEDIFLANPRFLGIRIFGEIYHYDSKRELSFEILDTFYEGISKVFELKDLPVIIFGRNYAFQEIGCNSNHIAKSADFYLKTVIDYFSGKFKGVNNNQIKDEKGSYISGIVELLRFCEFKEENIFHN